jgi:Zn-dependent protease
MLRRRGSIKLLEVLGIRVGVDATWFVFLFLVIFWLSDYFRRTLSSSDTVAYATTVATVLLFFASLIVHELGHALIARRQGIQVRRIELFLFGGVTQMSRDTATPGEELKVGLAGPAATLCFMLLCLAVDLAIVGPHRLWHAVVLDARVPITPVLLALSWLLLMNVAILAFNLLPAFPLDGGRVARAVVWRATGDKRRGTRAAARLGQLLALALGGAGAWLLARSQAVAGIWLFALAFLLWSSARAAFLQSAAVARLDGIRVADVMDADPVALPVDTPVAAALDEYFVRYGCAWLPVVDQQRHFIGISRRESLQAMLDAGEGWLTVRSATGTEEAAALRVPVEGPLTEALSSESLGRLGALVAVDSDGVLRGVLTAEQVRRVLRPLAGG